MGHGFIEPSCPGGAFVIHGKVQHRAVPVNGNSLYILTADVNNGSYLGIDHMYAHGVATDFGDIFVRKGHFISAVTRSHQISQIFRPIQFGDLPYGLLKRGLGAEYGVNPAPCGHMGR